MLRLAHGLLGDASCAAVPVPPGRASAAWGTP
jgi:hypothetical protein